MLKDSIESAIKSALRVCVKCSLLYLNFHSVFIFKKIYLILVIFNSLNIMLTFEVIYIANSRVHLLNLLVEVIRQFCSLSLRYLGGSGAYNLDYVQVFQMLFFYLVFHIYYTTSLDCRGKN